MSEHFESIGGNEFEPKPEQRRPEQLFAEQLNEYVMEYADASAAYDAHPNSANRLSMKRVGCIMGRLMVRTLIDYRQNVQWILSESQRLLETVMPPEELHAIKRGILQEYYTAIAFEDSGIPIRQSSMEDDLYRGTDFLADMSDFDGHIIDSEKMKFGTIALSVKHIDYWPVVAPMIWRWNNLEEFAGVVHGVEERLKHELQGDTLAARSYAYKVLERKGFMNQIRGAEVILHDDQAQALDIVHGELGRKISEMRDSLISSYAQMHGLIFDKRLKSDGTLVTFEKRETGNALGGIRAKYPNAAPALALLPGQSSYRDSTSGTHVNKSMYARNDVPSIISQKLYDELAGDNVTWSDAYPPPPEDTIIGTVLL